MRPTRWRYTPALLASVASVASFCAAASPLQAQTAASWLAPVSGTWTDATEWSTNPVVPNNGGGATYDASLAAAGSAYVVTIPSAVSLDQLTVASPDATAYLYGAPLSASNGITLSAGSLYVYGGTLSAVTTVLPGASVVLSSGSTNSGTINVNGGSLRIGNVYTSKLGTIHNTGGSVNITGLVTNDTSISPDLSGGPWTLASGAAIGGGTLTGAGANCLVALGGTLTGVSLNGELAVGDSSTPSVSVTASNLSLASGSNISLNAAAGSSLSLLISGAAPVLTGTATISFDGAGDGAVIAPASTGVTLTLASGLTVRTGTHGGTVGAAGSALVDNKAVLSAQTAGRTLNIAGSFNNQGLVEARNGGTVSLAVAPANLFSGTLTGGTWNVYDHSAITLPASATITTNAASITLTGPNSSFPALASLTSNSGTFALAGGRSVATASSLANSGSISVGPGSVLTVKGNLTNTGTLDLAGGTLLVDYSGSSPADAIRSQLQAGHLVSSTAAADPQQRQGIGYADASQLGVSSWAGKSVDSTTLVAKITWLGDANLDGKITGDDYALIDRGYARHLTGWVNGDFNYDGVVDSSDYMLIDRVFLQQSGVLDPALLAERQAEFGPAYVNALLTSVPEPASLALAVLGASLLGRRRRSA